ncbi:MAG: two-component system, chemotaxis family, CheB/CheR fusion protein [Phycisphaerales bacterium]|jgi:two-component system CheB/CheR fusion protein|nr:two-component system, chemotaxis family, CheB/CheR fusion protein [Phycisphaerales bacterium]
MSTVVPTIGPQVAALSKAAGRKNALEVRRLLEMLPAAAYTCDARGLITYFNRRAVEVWGREPKLNHDEDRFCGSFKLFTPQGAVVKHEECWMGLALRDQKPYHGHEIVVERPDGARTTVLAHANPFHDEFGTLTGAVNVLVDISERKRSEEALRASEERLRAMFASAAVGIGILTPAGQFVQVNDAYCSITGYSKEELCAMDCAAITHADDVAEMNVLLEELRAGARSSFVLEKRYITKPGGVVWVQTSVSAIRDAAGNVTNLTALCQDVTDRIRAEQARRRGEVELRDARDAAEAANRAKDRFLAVLSHELRTPLSPVVMTIAAMENDPNLPYSMRDDVRMIRRNIELETKLIDDLLDLSRVASGKLRLQMQPTSVHDLLQHIVETCAGEFAANRLQVKLELRAANDQVIGDRARLQQVFWNLIRNAIKFTPIGGAITLSSESIDEVTMRVQVRDTGVGIAPDVLPRLFNAFEQGEESITRKFGGLGLGLAIAKAVLDLHGGTLTAASEGAGHGAVFIVELMTAHPTRASSDEPGQASRGAAAAQPQRCGRILLVEDHADSARALAKLLGACGYVVKTAHTVAAALDLAAAAPFDLLISDLGLPDASGYELMESIRAQYGMKGIALSGYGMEEDLKRSRDAGFSDHVVKPVNVAQLEAVIRQLLEEKP